MAAEKSLAVFLAERSDKLAKWCAATVRPESLIRFALLDYARSEALQKCSHESIYLSLIGAAVLGLEPSGILGDGWIVPYGGTAMFVPGYRGKIKLVRRSGAVRDIYAHLVHKGDVFRFRAGSYPIVEHEIPMADRGPIIGAYGIAKLIDEGEHVETMTLAELEYTRSKARRGNKESPAWADWTGEMYRKTILHRLCKHLPQSAEMRKAEQMERAAENADPAAFRDAIDVEAIEKEKPEKAESSSLAKIRAAGEESIS